MQKKIVLIFASTFVTALFSFLLLVILPLPLIPCRSKPVIPGADWSDTYCQGYLFERRSAETIPGASVDLDRLLISSALISLGFAAIVLMLVTLYLLPKKQK